MSSGSSLRPASRIACSVSSGERTVAPGAQPAAIAIAASARAPPWEMARARVSWASTAGTSIGRRMIPRSPVLQGGGGGEVVRRVIGGA